MQEPSPAVTAVQCPREPEAVKHRAYPTVGALVPSMRIVPLDMCSFSAGEVFAMPTLPAEVIRIRSGVVLDTPEPPV